MNTSSAVISDCGQYRFRLDRFVAAEGKVFNFIGVNPSTADATLNDATVRKWIGFTKKNGGSRFIVTNLFGYRATDVNELKLMTDPFGPLNSRYMLNAVMEADIIVPCWGNSNKLPKSLRSHAYNTFEFLKSMVDQIPGKKLMTFGYTKGGDPLHPLMLGYSTELQEVPL